MLGLLVLFSLFHTELTYFGNKHCACYLCCTTKTKPTVYFEARNACVVQCACTPCRVFSASVSSYLMLQPKLNYFLHIFQLELIFLCFAHSKHAIYCMYDTAYQEAIYVIVNKTLHYYICYSLTKLNFKCYSNHLCCNSSLWCNNIVSLCRTQYAENY